VTTHSRTTRNSNPRNRDRKFRRFTQRPNTRFMPFLLIPLA
jgi:hypothetical protein